MWNTINAEKVQSTNTEYEKRCGRKKTFRVPIEFHSLLSEMPFFSDLRAKLEVAIEKVINSIRLANTFSRQNRGYTDEDDDESSSIPTSDNEDVRLSIFISF